MSAPSAPGFLRRAARYPPAFIARHPLRFARNLVGNRPSPLAEKYLRGLSGIEIGGSANNDFFLGTRNVDRFPDATTVTAQERYAGRIMPVDIVAWGDQLPLADGEVDFVLASHVLEHCWDAIGALREWGRVSRRYLFIVLPARDNPFDHAKPETPIAELERRFGRTPPDFDQHWSVWSSSSFVALCEHLGIEVVEVQDPDDKRGNGFAAVLDVSSWPPPA